ncbi:MAG: PD-(D/E)XK nuclease family protein [Treponema sp.]|nr:PD-(D/E)XK nuclease family protein [Treponema sp.]
MAQNKIESTIAAHIAEQNTVFVFPTQTAADLWADRATLTSGVAAVAMERFLAWDDFKSSSIKSSKQYKKAVPSVMRSVFASMLVSQNAASPFLRYFIAPKYAQEASGFTSWIAGLLPSLAAWKTLFEKTQRAGDNEDADLLALYDRYKNFLDAHDLFDPAWETPPFDADGKTYIIFYPELLMDYLEYNEILSSSPDIILIHFDTTGNAETTNEVRTADVPVSHSHDHATDIRPTVYFFSNARTELKHAVLAIKRAHEQHHIAWHDIALNVPDIDTYAPYIERELSLYCIPYSLRSGKTLSSSGAGSFFSQAGACVQNDFSFDSVKSLLLNSELPWKDEELNSSLIDFGKENNCLCAYEYGGKKIDVWQRSFANADKEQRLSNYYNSLKQQLTSLVRATTFSDINKKYFSFRETFFDMDNCSEQSDNIISRCIAELGALIDIEKEFPDCAVAYPYNFFVNHIAEKMYVAQNNTTGIHVLPYRLAAPAPFAFHVVIDASQASLSIVYKQLAFLRSDKRASLGFTDDVDVSNYFIRLYAENSLEIPAYFTASEKTFSTYSLSHSYLAENDMRFTPMYTDNDDMYAAEKSYMAQAGSFPKAITELERDGFAAWEKAQQNTASNDAATPHSTAYTSHAPAHASPLAPHNPHVLQNSFTLHNSLEPKIEKLIIDKMYQESKLRVTYSNLKLFYTCPRKFMLEHILGVQMQNNEAELMDAFAIGDLQHSILDYYCRALKTQNTPLMLTENGELPKSHKAILLKSIDEVVAAFKISVLGKELILTTKQAIAQNMTQAVVAFSTFFDGCRIAASEQEYTFHPEGKNYYCLGRIDCLLQNEIGDYLLVDFKSSRGSIHKKLFYVNDDVDVPDFQMPMYVHLLEHQTPPIAVESAAFFNIGEASKKDGTTSNMLVPVTGSFAGKKEHVVFETTQNRFLELLDKFAERIATRNFAIDAERQNFDTCSACAYKAVCRRTFTVGKSSE